MILHVDPSLHLSKENIKEAGSGRTVQDGVIFRSTDGIE